MEIKVKYYTFLNYMNTDSQIENEINEVLEDEGITSENLVDIKLSTTGDAVNILIIYKVFTKLK